MQIIHGKRISRLRLLRQKEGNSLIKIMSQNLLIPIPHLELPKHPFDKSADYFVEEIPCSI